jgi:hypothetical protein
VIASKYRALKRVQGVGEATSCPSVTVTPVVFNASNANTVVCKARSVSSREYRIGDMQVETERLPRRSFATQRVLRAAGVSAVLHKRAAVFPLLRDKLPRLGDVTIGDL